MRPPDAYARLLRSERYRRERAARAESILALCGKRLETAERSADLGSGTGLVKKKLEMTLNKYIYGFEIDRSFIEWRRGTAAADVLRLPAADRAFDLLLLNHLYEHVEDQPGLFVEAHRVLRPGGLAYVAAGNRLAVLEPHYRLPFLSWLPGRLADAYLRASGRGRAYEGIRFRTYGRVRTMMEAAGFRVYDITERAIQELLDRGRSRGWRGVWRALRALPASARRRLLHGLSPQWFFLLEKPPAVPSGARGSPGSEGG